VPTQPVQPATGLDSEELFTEHARRLHIVVSRSVRTSAANVDDACGFAWLQLMHHRPPGRVAFAWLCTTAVREAIKLDRRMTRDAGFDHALELVSDPVGPERKLELILAGEQIRAAQLRPRERRLIALRVVGYSGEEIAGITGDSCRTVDRQLARAQRRLRDVRRQESL
jgi:RNA polymerase sigma factor (sigma-70 family)